MCNPSALFNKCGLEQAISREKTVNEACPTAKSVTFTTIDEVRSDKFNKTNKVDEDFTIAWSDSLFCERQGVSPVC